MSQVQNPRPVLTFFISVTPLLSTAIRQLTTMLTLIDMVSKAFTKNAVRECVPK